MLKCKVRGCKRPHRARHFCGMHLKRWERGKLNAYDPDGSPWLDNRCNSDAKVAAEIARGKRCRCGLLKPCQSCLPDGYEVAGRAPWGFL